MKNFCLGTIVGVMALLIGFFGRDILFDDGRIVKWLIEDDSNYESTEEIDYSYKELIAMYVTDKKGIDCDEIVVSIYRDDIDYTVYNDGEIIGGGIVSKNYLDMLY